MRDREIVFLTIHALLLLAQLVRWRTLEKAAEQIEERCKEGDDSAEALQYIGAETRQARLALLLCAISLSWWVLR